MDLENLLDEVLSYEATEKNWGKIHNSKEFIAASKLARGLNHSLTSGCSDCLNDLFMMAKILKRDKNKLLIKQEVMNSTYELYPNKVLSFPKLGIHITNANLTDEIAKEYLTIYPAARVHFKVIPESHFATKVVIKKEEKISKVADFSKIAGVIEVPKAKTLRQLADELAKKKGIRKPHYKSSDFTLEKFLQENS